MGIAIQHVRAINGASNITCMHTLLGYLFGGQGVVIIQLFKLQTSLGKIHSGSHLFIAQVGRLDWVIDVHQRDMNPRFIYLCVYDFHVGLLWGEVDLLDSSNQGLQ